MTKTTEHNLINCPECGEAVNTSVSFDADAAPQPGDISVCLDCATVLSFTAVGKLLGLRVVSDEEWRAFAAKCPEQAKVVREARRLIQMAQVETSDADADVAAIVKLGDVLWKRLRTRFSLPLASAIVLDMVMECAHDIARERPTMREHFTAEIVEGMAVAFEPRRLN